MLLLINWTLFYFFKRHVGLEAVCGTVIELMTCHSSHHIYTMRRVPVYDADTENRVVTVLKFYLYVG